MTTQKVTIVVGGEEYEGWQSCSVTKSVLEFAGSFSITTKTRKDFPFFAGQPCQILIEEKPVINGFIDKITREKSSKAHQMTLSGQDRTIDLDQSTSSDNLVFSAANMSLKQVIEKTLREVNLSHIKVIDEVGNLKNFEKTDYVASTYGGTYFDFLETYARMRQVLLTTDGNGDILITRANQQRVYKTIIDNDSDTSRLNVEFLNANIDYSDLFRFYFCEFTMSDALSNFYVSNPGYGKDDHGVSIDNEIRSSRFYHFQTEYASDSLTAEKRALWQRNYHKSKAISLSYKVDGFIPIDDPDKLWAPNYLVVLRDSEMLRSDARMLIKSVAYRYTIGGGSDCTLTLTDKLALSLEAEKPTSDADENTATAQYFKNSGGN